MTAQVIDGVEAWQNLMRTPQSRWGWDEDAAAVGSSSESARSRLERGPPFCAIAPRFTISPTDTFFCIGSCFARNIEEALIYSGVSVSSRKIVCPKDEWPHRPAGLVNKFTSHSMLNEVEWAFGKQKFADDMIYETQGGFVDLQLVPGAKPVSLERALERRRYLISEYFSRIAEADVIVITLGLVEAWYDALTEKYLNAPPSFWMARKHRDRLQLHVLSHAQNYTAVSAVVDLINSTERPKKIILTVSPVPMGDTFSGADVIMANAYSKATLRSVAGECVQRFANVDYFPSYENITLMANDKAYYRDRLHVTDEVVRDNISCFLAHYMPGMESTTTDFAEMAYLEANPDVEHAVRLAQFDSGFDHWKRIGRAEGRAMRTAG